MGCKPSSERSNYLRIALNQEKLNDLLKKHKKKFKKPAKKDESELYESLLRLDFRHTWCKGLVSNISNKYRLPALDTLALRYLPILDEDIQYFLEQCMDETNNLFLNNYVTNQIKVDKLEIDPYFEAINLAIPKVMNSIWIEYFRLTSRQLAQLIRHCSHLKSVRFEWCDIERSENDSPSGHDKPLIFTNGVESKIEYLGFKGCKYECRIVDKDALEIIIKASVHLKFLKYLDITESTVSEKEADSLLKKNGLDYVKVIKYR